MPCGGRKTSPTQRYSAYYMFLWSFGIIGLILSQFENRVLLKPVLVARAVITITLLHMNRLNKTETAFCVSVMYSSLLEDLHSKLISFNATALKISFLTTKTSAV